MTEAEIRKEVDDLIKFINTTLAVLSGSEAKQFNPSAPVLRAIATMIVTREAALKERIRRVERLAVDDRQYQKYYIDYSWLTTQAPGTRVTCRVCGGRDQTNCGCDGTQTVEDAISFVLGEMEILCK